MLDLAAPRVPVEFVGLARVFRSQVKLVDVAMNEVLIAITTPLRARLSRRFTIPSIGSHGSALTARASVSVSAG